MELKKFTRLTMLLSLSVVLNIFESFIPLFNGFIPGLKLGLANSIVLMVLYLFSFKDAIYISILRVFMVGILRIGLFSVTFCFSLGGAILSVISMALAKKYTKLSIIGVSIVGSIMHSIGQILVAIIILKTYNIIYYLPWLLIFSIPTGIFIGVISKELVKYFEKRLKLL
ncbi:MAG: Gx transporter family protein [Mollicutes bacterium]|jgi:heptaprenyl diphosphate synthase|nr:Gx transporter family protein [Mollicutes bacterium]